MKAVLTLILASFSFGMVAMAADGDLEHNVGQGLGTIIFEGQDGLVQQVLAATTNGSFGNQTFAISSGTLGARQADTIVKNETINRFVAENMDNLTRDIAVGKGESLSTLAVLMEVPEAERAEFGTDLRRNFDRIYTHDGVTSTDVVNAIAKLRA